MRSTGRYVISTTTGEAVRAFVPHPLPPRRPSLDAAFFEAANHAAELALARLVGVAGLVPSVDWLLYSAIRKEALLTSQIEGIQATLVDVFDDEAGIAVSNADDVEEVTNDLRAFRHVREALHDPRGLLPQPLMYLSAFLKQHQAEYYRRLAAVRTEGDWEGWVGFFLEGVAVAAQAAERAIVALASLITADRRRLLDAPKANAASFRLFELLPTMPRLTIERARQALDTTFPTATAAVRQLEDLGILQELTGQKKNRNFAYRAYIDVLST